jgi:hypothetical protein
VLFLHTSFATEPVVTESLTALEKADEKPEIIGKVTNKERAVEIKYQNKHMNLT